MVAAFHTCEKGNRHIVALEVLNLSVLAIIPARAGSKRLPDKNLLPFIDAPLIAWSIRFAKQIPQFDKVIVSTDSPEIAKVALREGVDVPWMRPLDIAGDTATSVQVALHALERERAEGNTYDGVALLQPTSPIRLKLRWEQGFDLLGSERCDAVVGVSPMNVHPYHGFDWSEKPLLRPFGDVAQLKLRTQELPSAVHVNGSLYIVRTPVLEQEHTFFPAKTFGVLCDNPVEAIDIDTESDFVVGRALAEHFGVWR